LQVQPQLELRTRASAKVSRDTHVQFFTDSLSESWTT
jgi:hypothetical protein